MKVETYHEAGALRTTRYSDGWWKGYTPTHDTETNPEDKTRSRESIDSQCSLAYLEKSNSRYAKIEGLEPWYYKGR